MLLHVRINSLSRFIVHAGKSRYLFQYRRDPRFCIPGPQPSLPAPVVRGEIGLVFLFVPIQLTLEHIKGVDSHFATAGRPNEVHVAPPGVSLGDRHTAERVSNSLAQQDNPDGWLAPTTTDLH